MKRCLLLCGHFRRDSANGLRNQTNDWKNGLLSTNSPFNHVRTIEDVMDDETPNYGAIIVEKTHPDLDLILARFNELAAFLKK